MPPSLSLGVKLVITLWLLAVSVWDHQRRRVPNWLVLPVMFGALGWRIYEALFTEANALGFVLVAWIALFLLWRGHIFGGGDAKFLMAILAIFATTQFLIFFSLVVLGVSLPLLIIQSIKTRSLPFQRKGGGRAGLPTAEDLHQRGRPYCWTLALPGIIYLWLPEIIYLWWVL
jgi:Flp pilus assembly protein protease CpaA